MPRFDDTATRRIRTSLYKDQRFTSAELDLLHTPSLQRHYDLRQLGFADRVFIDASHTRLAHVVGVVEVATRLCATIARNLRKSERARRPETPVWSDGTTEFAVAPAKLADLLSERVGAIRLMALLHDLTHAPFGHTLEDEIELVHPGHDHPDRQADAFLRILLEYLAWTATDMLPAPVLAAWESKRKFPLRALTEGRADLAVEAISDATVIEFGSLLLRRDDADFGKTRVPPEERARLLIDLNFATRALFHLKVAHKFKTQELPAASYRVNRLIEAILREESSNAVAARWTERAAQLHPEDQFVPARDAFCLDLIGNTICADLLDYARRDALNGGLPLSFDVDRIIDNFTLVSHLAPEASAFGAHPEHPLRHRALRAAVEFSNSKFRGDVIGEVIQLLQVRYYVFERMLYHPTKCVAGSMLGRAVQLLGFVELPAAWQRTGDATFINQIGEVTDLLLYVLRSPNAETVDILTPEVAASHASRLTDLPLLSIKAARQALDQRVLTVKHLRERFATPRSGGSVLARYLHAAGLLEHAEHKALEMLAAGLVAKGWSDETKLDSVKLGELASHLAPQVARALDRELNDVMSAVKEGLRKQWPTVQATVAELEAARHLIARLGARRYAKRIFCLMPSSGIKVAGFTLDRHELVELFLDAGTRSAAERAIELRAKLPVGSVVIHCPPADGPTKLAEVLVTYLVPGGENPAPRKTIKLRDISKITGPAGSLFEAHEAHITSLEKMYVSMWRLWIAVTPPQDKNYKNLGNVIGEVMSGCVLGTSRQPVQNDVFLVEELAENYFAEPPAGNLQLVSQPPVVHAPKIGRSDVRLSVEEINAILQPYLDTFHPTRRRQIRGMLNQNRVVERLSERSSDPNIHRSLLSRRIEQSLAAPTWDAREIERFVEHVKRLADVADPWETRPHPFVRLNDEEKEAMNAVRRTLFRETRLHDLGGNESGVRLAAFAKAEGIKVHFQPLFTPGLCAQEGSEHVIYLNTDTREHADRCRAIFHAGEDNAQFLPAELRFTFAHELIHHLIATRGIEAFEDPTKVRKGYVTERVCDILAGELLLSDSALRKSVYPHAITAQLAANLCRTFGISPRLLVSRMDAQGWIHQDARGQALCYARSDGEHLVTIQAFSTRNLHGHIKTMRDLRTGDTLPLPNRLVGRDSFDGLITMLADDGEQAQVRLTEEKWPLSDTYYHYLCALQYPASP